MYNRYIPTENGGYRRQVVEDHPRPANPPQAPPPQTSPPEPVTKPGTMTPLTCPSQPKPKKRPGPPQKPPHSSNATLTQLLDGVDKGDLILLLILVLLLMDGETDNGTLLLTVALYFLLQ